jgi:hypothetical protein
MKPLSGEKQLGLALPLELVESSQVNNPSNNETGLDVSHHACISPRAGEKSFSLTSFFIG